MKRLHNQTRTTFIAAAAATLAFVAGGCVRVEPGRDAFTYRTPDITPATGELAYDAPGITPLLLPADSTRDVLVFGVTTDSE